VFDPAFTYKEVGMQGWSKGWWIGLLAIGVAGMGSVKVRGEMTTLTLHLTASPTSPQLVNTNLTLVASLNSNSALEYKFLAISGAGLTTILQNYSTKVTCAWTPTMADNYSLIVCARPLGNVTASPYQASIPFVVISKANSAVTDTVSTDTPNCYYVAMNGNDAWSGKLSAPNGDKTDGPFATLEAAQNAIQARKASGPLPPGGITVWIRGGSYFRGTPFSLSAGDSGTTGAPITYQAYTNEVVRITGGKTVVNFIPVTDGTILNRLPATAQANVVQANLTAQGITDFGQFTTRGSYYLPATAALELFYQDQPMTLARWPNPGSWATITAVPNGASGATIGYTGTAPAKWSNVQDSWLHGFWNWNWADSYVKVASIDTTNQMITTASPYAGAYGFRVGGRFYAQNILEELDQPGEWYLDRQTGMLYFWPPAPLASGEVTVSITNTPLITLNATNYLSLNGLIVECSRGTGITVTGGANNSIVNCTIRNMGNYAVDIEGGSSQGITNCLLTGEGDGGIIINGTGLFANNNEIAHYARWVYCYQAGIHVLGSGNVISHNKIYDAPHNAILMDGANQTLEYNEITQVILQTQDCGAIYTGGNGPNIIRYNFLHDLGKGQLNTTQTPFAAAIYNDNGGSNLTVTGNILVNGAIGLLINGGNGNTITNNVISGFTDVWCDGSGGYPFGNLISTNVLVDNAPLFRNGAYSLGNTIQNNLLSVDPLFVDPAHYNFQLQANSPAYSQITGFQTIPFSQIGRK